MRARWLPIGLGLGLALLVWFLLERDAAHPEGDRRLPNLDAQGAANPAAREGGGERSEARTEGAEPERTDPDGPLPTRLPALRARLVDSEGRPAAGVGFEVVTVDPRLDALTSRLPGMTLPGSTVHAQGRSAPDGAIAVARLPVGEPLEWRALPGDWLPVQRRFRIEDAPVDLGPIPLARAATLGGVVRGPDGTPVADAFVRALPTTQGIESSLLLLLAQAGEGRADGEVATDEEGRFRLGGLSPGASVELYVRAVGAPALRQVVAAPGAGAAGELVLRFPPGPEIRGRVVDRGEPVADVEVRARRVDDAPALEPVQVARPARTDAYGTFRLWGLPAGRWEVTARAGGRVARADAAAGRLDVLLELPRLGTLEVRVRDASTGRPLAGVSVTCERLLGERALYGGPAETSDAAGKVTFEDLDPGEVRLGARAPEHVLLEPLTTRVDAGPNPALELHLERAARLEVHVRGPGGEGVPDADVWARGSADPAWNLAQPAGRASADAEGRALLTGLGEGPYVVHVRHAAHAPGRLEVELSLGDVREAAVTLERGAVVHGRVLRSGGEPAPGRPVALLAAGRAAETRVADDAGAFRFEHLEPGAYRLRLDRSASAPLDFVLPEARSDVLEFELGPGEEREVTLHAPPEATLIVACDETLDADERRGARVALVPSERADEMLSSVAIRGGRPLGPDGRVVFAGVPPGSYVATFLAQGAHVPIEERVELAADATHTWRVRLPTGVLRGTVRAADGAPAAGARLSVQRVDAGGRGGPPGLAGLGVLEVLTAEDGTFALERLPDGAFVVDVRRTGEGARSLPVEITGGGVVDGVALQLGRYAVHGRVVEPDGAAVADAEVVATPLEGPSSRAVGRTDRLGRFALDGLGAGTWTVRATAGGRAAAGRVTFGGAALPGSLLLTPR